jgi:hypothetical protein
LASPVPRRVRTAGSSAEILGTLTAGLALDDTVARELSEITQSEVTLVAGSRISGSSLQGEGRAELSRLVESANVPLLQPGSLVLRHFGDSKYLSGAFPLMSAAGGPPAGHFVLAPLTGDVGSSSTAEAPVPRRGRRVRLRAGERTGVPFEDEASVSGCRRRRADIAAKELDAQCRCAAAQKR